MELVLRFLFKIKRVRLNQDAVHIPYALVQFNFLPSDKPLNLIHTLTSKCLPRMYFQQFLSQWYEITQP